MLLTNMAIRPETGEAPDGTTGRTELRLVMEWAVSPEEATMLTSMFNQGKPTAKFWEAIETGEAPSVGGRAVVVSARQSGSTAPKSTLMVPIGSTAALRIPVIGYGPGEVPILGHVAIDVEVRAC